jgi:hypothetical protein
VSMQLFVWNGLIPLKVSVLEWRIMQNRIPTKDNLVKRGVLIESQKLCTFGCGKDENVSHVFNECKLAEEVWQQILNWLNIYTPSGHYYKQKSTF